MWTAVGAGVGDIGIADAGGDGGMLGGAVGCARRSSGLGATGAGAGAGAAAIGGSAAAGVGMLGAGMAGAALCCAAGAMAGAGC